MNFTSIVPLMLLLAACTGPDKHSFPEEDPDRVVISDRISNQTVNAFAEDTDGHIWIGTFRGLNKYDVHEYHQYFCTDDTTGLPDNRINALFRSSDGKLWVATVDGIAVRTDKGDFQRIHLPDNDLGVNKILETSGGTVLFSNTRNLYKYFPEEDTLRLVIRDMNAIIPAIVLDGNDRLWVPTVQGIDCYETASFSKVASVQVPYQVYHLRWIGDGELWMSGIGNISIYDTQNMRWKELPDAVRKERRIMDGDVDIIYSVDERTILLHVIGVGMFDYNRSTERVIFQEDAGFPFDLPDHDISTIFRDSRQNLWFGTTDHGYSVSYHYKDQFNSNKHLTSFFSGKTVTSLFLEDGNRLWITTQAGGLFIYDISTREIRSIEVSHLPENSNLGYIRPSKVLKDSNGDIWILFPEKYQAVRCSFDGRDLRRIESVWMINPLAIAEDERGFIWIGGMFGALLRYDPSSRSTMAVPLEGAGWMSYVSDLLVTEPGRMRAAVYNTGMFEVNTYSLEAKELVLSEEEMKACIIRSEMAPNKLFEDSSGDYWTGTIANGLLMTGRDGRTVPVPGAPCPDITSIEQDRQGNIWVSTMNGLGRFDRTTGTFVNYFEADGIGGNQFSNSASCLLEDGTLVFGGTHGITWFNPLDVPQKHTVPLVFEDLKIYNRLVRPAAGGPVERELARDPDILLKDWQDAFSISFAALDYSEHERTHYYYKMDGFDRDWVDAGNNHEAYYANLPAGKYRFRVKITNNSQSIVETEKALNITVLPPWYRTWWSQVLFILAALTLAGALWLMAMKVRRERAEAAARVQDERLERERAEAARKQEKELALVQMRYFSNLAHEFRTPLTMIAGPASQLADSPGIKGQDRQLVGIIQRNSNWMLSLVNQFLDFNRIGNSKLQMKVARTDIAEPLKSVADMFRFNAESKRIELTTRGLEEPFMMLADVDKVRKVVMNLLANALKFTPAGGKVSLAFDVLGRADAAAAFPLKEDDADPQWACICVSDSGSGIPEGEEERIFERFYQAGNQVDTLGSGIGLYYSRVLTGLHHGYIKAANKPEGGAIFSFIIPTGAESYSDDEKSEVAQEIVLPQAVEVSGPAEEVGSDRLRIAVVDDDIDIANYLKVLLSPNYNITVYFDGTSALKGMIEEAPNLIISDVVMPGMSGYELCKAVKGELQLSHIPVVLVTAKVAVENQVEGLGVGADAYVTKPFQPAYLLALVKSLLENREKLHRLLGEATTAEEIGTEELTPRDKAFMKDLYELMEKEIADSELDITRISEMMKMSRTKFYYKVKGLTGENPSAFFKRFKLNFAANLLKEGRYNMSEIAYMTGFNTLSHFSTSFKKQFGVPPSEYSG